MRPLAGSGVLADDILIPPHQLIPPTNIRMVRLEKSTETSNRKTIY